MQRADRLLATARKLKATARGDEKRKRKKDTEKLALAVGYAALRLLADEKVVALREQRLDELRNNVLCHGNATEKLVVMDWR